MFKRMAVPLIAVCAAVFALGGDLTARRLTAHLGYNVTSTTGSALFLNPNAPSGPLDSNYHRPYGGVDYAIAKRWTGKAYWGYYGYHEDQSPVPQDLFAPRNFRGKLVTISMRYAF